MQQLHRLRDLNGYYLNATDGEIGHLQEVCDQPFLRRFVVVGSNQKAGVGSRFPGAVRQVDGLGGGVDVDRVERVLEKARRSHGERRVDTRDQRPQVSDELGGQGPFLEGVRGAIPLASVSVNGLHRGTLCHNNPPRTRSRS